MSNPTNARPHPIVKAIADSGCNSWIVGCPATAKALLVDPKVGRRDTILDNLHRLGLEVVAVVDTHTHADHLSDSRAWVDAGATLFMSRHTGCRRPLTRVGDGDEIRAGDLRFRVLEVPGHTADSIALAGEGLVVTGDTLFAGGLARSDFRGSDAARLFTSVREKLLALPDATVVLPGHGYRDVLFSTIGHERAHNPALRHPDGATYAKAAGDVEGRGNTPDVDAMLAANLDADPDLPATGKTVAACCAAGGADAGGPGAQGSPARRPAPPREQTPDELAPRRAALTDPTAPGARSAWIDVREAWEFAQAHIPGTRNIPLAELGFHLDDVRGRAPLVLSCLGGVRSMTAARTLVYLGVADAPISMAGGFRRWQQSGFPIEQGASVPPA